MSSAMPPSPVSSTGLTCPVVFSRSLKRAWALSKSRMIVFGADLDCDFQVGGKQRLQASLSHDGVNAELRALSSGVVLENKEGGTVVVEEGSSVRLEPGRPFQVNEVLFEVIWPIIHTQPLPGPMPPPPPPRVWFHGKPVRSFPVEHGMWIGRASQGEVQVPDAGVSSKHVLVEIGDEGVCVEDQGRNPARLNGQLFKREALVFGDQLQIGRISLRFTGQGFEVLDLEAATGVQATRLTVRRQDGQAILRDASLVVGRGEFVGILGPSGAGKTTLMRAVTGLIESEGHVKVLGRKPGPDLGASGLLGFVPQQDIVPLELTARQAIWSAAKLRLPKATTDREIERLIERLASQLSLTEHLDTPVGRMSGGQRKRVNVCVELLGRPRVLFLDEPTSGLDPATEEDLMVRLQALAATGCSVICTTHLMDHVYLMDQLEVLAPIPGENGERVAGENIFRGRPQDAKAHFEVDRVGDLYEALPKHPPQYWKQKWQASEASLDAEKLAEGMGQENAFVEDSVRRQDAPMVRRMALPILLQRQWDLLKADSWGLWLLLGQPIVIAMLIAMTGLGESAGPAKIFLANIAVFWFGCSNAAQEIVKERAIFEREKFAGLSPLSYLGSKVLGNVFLTMLQAVLVMGVLHLMGGISSDLGWVSLGLLSSALVSVSLGLAISAGTKSRTQAAMWVPLAIIPQILFSGFVFPVKDWRDSVVAKGVAFFNPSFHLQRVLDVGALWDRPIERMTAMEPKGLNRPLENLSESLIPWKAWWSSKAEFDYQIDERVFYRPLEEGSKVKPAKVYDLKWPLSRTAEENLPFHYDPTEGPSFQLNQVYAYAKPAWDALGVLLGMAFVFLFLATRFLKVKR